MTVPPLPQLVIATHNAGKLHEFRVLLQDFAADIASAGELGLPEPVENGATFRANARLKAEAAWRATGLAALADDSGLCVTALGGDPGIFSARWAVTPDGRKDFPAAMRRIHEKMGDNPDRSAAFLCALTLMTAAGEVIEVEGRLDGSIVWPPRGTNGHGYDPFFLPIGETRTLAEMPDEAKNAVSHRGKALKLLVKCLRK